MKKKVTIKQKFVALTGEEWDTMNDGQMAKQIGTTPLYFAKLKHIHGHKRGTGKTITNGLVDTPTDVIKGAGIKLVANDLGVQVEAVTEYLKRVGGGNVTSIAS